MARRADVMVPRHASSSFPHKAQTRRLRATANEVAVANRGQSTETKDYNLMLSCHIDMQVGH